MVGAAFGVAAALAAVDFGKAGSVEAATASAEGDLAVAAGIVLAAAGDLVETVLVAQVADSAAIALVARAADSVAIVSAARAGSATPVAVLVSAMPGGDLVGSARQVAESVALAHQVEVSRAPAALALPEARRAVLTPGISAATPVHPGAMLARSPTPGPMAT